MKERVRKYLGRTTIIGLSLVVWFWTQSLIGHRAAGHGIVDKVHEFTQPLNDYLQAHPQSANALLIASSLVIDCLGIFLIGASIFGRTLRPFVAMLLVFGMRQLCQWLCTLPPPEQMIWRDPGFPSLLVTYGVTNDLFFSGHTAIAVLGAIELYRLCPRVSVLVASCGIVIFEVSTVLILRAHYTMDVFAGAMAAIVASGVANWICFPVESRRKTGVEQKQS
jgi:membrane-associated phospholipid phosphatase